VSPAEEAATEIIIPSELQRDLDEEEPTLKNFAKVVPSLEGHAGSSLPE